MKINVSKELEFLFDKKDPQKDGSYLMYETFDNSKKRLYLLNNFGRKILQIRLKQEKYSNKIEKYLQLNLIPYKISEAKVYNDQSSKPKKYSLREDIKFTYHGGYDKDKLPKIHLKLDSKANKYKTLVNSSFSLKNSELLLVPIRTVYLGYLSDQHPDDEVRKISHIFYTSSKNNVKYDIFFSGENFDLSKYFQTMVSFNMFFELDFLISQKNSPIIYCQLTDPIKGFLLDNNYIFIRSTITKYSGKPFIQFYNNENYYTKFMNRNVALMDKDKSLTWSNMYEQERRINNGYYFK